MHFSLLALLVGVLAGQDAFAAPMTVKTTGASNQTIARELHEARHGDLTPDDLEMLEGLEAGDLEMLEGLEAGRRAFLLELRVEEISEKNFRMRRWNGDPGYESPYASNVEPLRVSELYYVSEETLERAAETITRWPQRHVSGMSARKQEAFRMGMLLTVAEALSQKPTRRTYVPEWSPLSKGAAKYSLGFLSILGLMHFGGGSAHEIESAAFLTSISAGASLVLRGLERFAGWAGPYGWNRAHREKIEGILKEANELKVKLCAPKLAPRY